MKVFPLLILILGLLIALTSSKPGFCFMPQSPLSNPQNFTKLAFSGYIPTMVLYGQHSKTVTPYNSLSWTLEQYPNTINYEKAPTLLDFYSQKQFPDSAIYMTSQGEIRSKVVIWRYNEVKDYLVFQLKCANSSSKKRFVSKGRQYIAYCQGEKQAIFGDTAEPLTPRRWFVPEYPIRTIIYLGTVTAMISGGSGNNKYLIMVSLFSTMNYSHIIDCPVVAMAYSQDQNLLYFAEEKIGDDQIIWQFNFKTAEKKKFTELKNQNQVTSLAVKIDHLSAMTEGYEHIWQIQGAVYLGRYETVLEKSGFTPYGFYLLTVEKKDPSHVYLRWKCQLPDDEESQRQEFLEENKLSKEKIVENNELIE